MASLDELHEDILHQLAQLFSKSDIFSLRLTSRHLFIFLTPYLDKLLVSEIRAGTHTHLHRAAAIPPKAPDQDHYKHGIIVRLVKEDAPVNQHGENSETALHSASRSGNLAAMHSLLNAGAEVDALSFHGWTPLRLACRYGYADAARVLLDFGAGTHESGSFGWTAMQYALWNGHEECVEVLREYGVTSTDALTTVNTVKQQWGIYVYPNKPI